MKQELSYTTRQIQQYLDIEFSHFLDSNTKRALHAIGWWYNPVTHSWRGTENFKAARAIAKQAAKESIATDRRQRQSLCWDCQHAGKGRNSVCPWAQNYKPVEGWKAEPTKIKLLYKSGEPESYVDSFHVYECPIFLSD